MCGLDFGLMWFGNCLFSPSTTISTITQLNVLIPRAMPAYSEGVLRNSGPHFVVWGGVGWCGKRGRLLAKTIQFALPSSSPPPSPSSNFDESSLTVEVIIASPFSLNREKISLNSVVVSESVSATYSISVSVVSSSFSLSVVEDSPISAGGGGRLLLLISLQGLLTRISLSVL